MSELQFGKFLNTEPFKGYMMGKARDEWRLWLWPVPIYQIKILEPTPLLWQAPDGHQEKCVPEFEIDGCSIPPFMWNLPALNPDRFLLTGIHHDCGCKYGGLMVRGISEKEFHFRRMSRLELDTRLRMWVGAEGGNAFQRAEYYRGVRLGSAFQKHPLLHYWDMQAWEERRDGMNPSGMEGILKPA